MFNEYHPISYASSGGIQLGIPLIDRSYAVVNSHAYAHLDRRWRPYSS